jgi:predicted nucleic acid-binding protein
MDEADAWFVCRVGYVETVRAVGLVAGATAAEAVKEEWSSFGVVEIDQRLVERAASLAIESEGQLRSLDALHLAAGLLLPRDGLVFATWDRRLHAAAAVNQLALLPEMLD